VGDRFAFFFFLFAACARFYADHALAERRSRIRLRAARAACGCTDPDGGLQATGGRAISMADCAGAGARSLPNQTRLAARRPFYIGATRVGATVTLKRQNFVLGQLPFKRQRQPHLAHFACPLAGPESSKQSGDLHGSGSST